MNVKRHEGHEREVPNAHIYHSLLPIIFVSIWILDSVIFRFSILLNNYIPFLVRLVLFIIIFVISLILITLSHRTLFTTHQPPNKLITSGILRYVRNPMYLGILLIYLAFLFLSISLIGIGIFIIIFLVYDWMVNYEEKLLEDMFGEEYKKYKTKVSKWIPNPFKK
ncbi:MAG: methyltransferase family protein [Candidatus Thorarchaeota archaeon]